MKGEDLRQAEELFSELVHLPGDVRTQRLEAECADRPQMRALVARLLDSDDSAGAGFLCPTSIDAELDVLTTPKRVGAYQVQRIIGEGGMGVVYEAQQEHPRRRVALKVIRPERVSRSMVSRFRHEAAVLGHLRHSGIAHIYEASTAEMELHNGIRVTTPFFAMEFIDGRPLLEHVEACGASLIHRLELFARICDAVGYAHQKGVIHRDLKPANILITHESTPDPMPSHSPGGDALPKILDFGIARAVGSSFETLTLDSGPQQIVGTVPYMSPEQLGGDVHQLDTRADVYSLGVILFQLLTGELPHAVSGRALPQLVRSICDSEAPRPSQRSRGIPKDLDIICASAMAKDRARRYASALDLAAEVRRHLRHEPILARKQTLGYLISRAVHRHRAAAALTLGLAITVLASAVALALAYQGQTRERRRAQGEALKSGRVVDILREMLQQADPDQGHGPEYTVVRMLDDFAARRLYENVDDPEIEATVRETLGVGYRGLALMEKAERELQAALDLRRRAQGEKHPSVARLLAELAKLRYLEAKDGEAFKLAEQALEMRRALYGETHLEIAASLDQVAALHQRRSEFDTAQELYEKALAIRRALLPDEHAEIATSLSNLASLHQHRGDLAAAEPLMREAVRMGQATLGGDHPDLASRLFDLASLRQARGDFIEAEDLYGQALDMNRRLFGPNHRVVAWTLTGLASLYRTTQRLDEAQATYREAIRIWEADSGRTHPGFTVALNNLGNVLLDLGEFHKGEEAFREALATARASSPRLNSNGALYLNNLCGALREQLRYAEAEEVLKESFEAYESLQQPARYPPVSSFMTRARLHRDQGRTPEASADYELAREKLIAEKGPGHPHVQRVSAEWAMVLSDLGETARAIDLSEQALQTARGLTPRQPPVEAEALLALGKALLVRGGSGDAPRAVDLCAEAHEFRKTTYSREHWLAGEAEMYWGLALDRCGRIDEGQEHLKRAHDVFERSLGPDHPRTRQVAQALVSRTPAE